MKVPYLERLIDRYLDEITESSGAVLIEGVKVRKDPYRI
jgi:hypothetical protein